MENRKPCVYLSGPMSGHADHNFPAFNKAAETLRGLGYPVINPADFGANPNLSWRDCLARDLAVLVHCEAIVTLPGYSMSKGASLEVHIASRLGMPIIPYEIITEKTEIRFENDN